MEYNYWKCDAQVGLMLYGCQPTEGHFVPYFFKVNSSISISKEELNAKFFDKLYELYARFQEMARGNEEDSSYMYLQSTNSTRLSDEEVANKIWLSTRVANWEDSNCFLMDEKGIIRLDLESF